MLKKCIRLSATVCVSSLFLVSCGGGSSGDGNTTGGSLIVDGGSGVSADNVDTSVLLRKAATGASTNLGKNITGMQRLGVGSSSVGLLLDATALDSLTQLTASEVDAESINPDALLNTAVEEDIGSFFNAMLGLDEQLAVVTRTGNHIIIDPDDAAFCERELLDDTATADERANCQSLVSNLLVEMDAVTEDSGLITVTFAQQDLLLVGYSPMAVNYEIKLPGLQTLLDQAAQLDGESVSIPSMQGAVRISATVTNDAVNAEAGTFSISITEALSIVDNAGTNISLRPSTLLSVSADAATGSGSVEFNIGALNATSSVDNGIGGLTTSVLAFTGLTARMDISNNGNSLLVSNVGIGNGPLTLTVDSVEQLRLMLETFGFSVQGDTGIVSLDGNLDFELSLGQVSTLAAVAPAGTMFGMQANGSSQVTQGGPLVVSVLSDNAGTPVSDSISIGAGECFIPDESFDSTLPFVLEDCDL